MFRRRNSEKKPSSDLLMSFQQNFPHLSQQNNTGAPSTQAPDAADHSYTDLAFDSSDFPDQHAPKDYESPSQAFQSLDPNFKSSDFLDSSAINFADVNHVNDMWPPTPGGPLFGGFHEGAGKDHSIYPVSVGMDTPVSASASNAQSLNSRSQSLNLNDSLHRASTMSSLVGGAHFNQTQTVPSHAFDFSMPGHQQCSTFPSNVRMSDLSYDPTQNQPHLSLGGVGRLTQGKSDREEPLSPHSSSQFRFQVILKAPTAMVKHRDEIPITYLNKCQTYTISVADTMPQHDLISQVPRYRTSIRIAFEDENQRQRPETCWKLWRDGRGKDEAHKRGGRLQAVEYAKPDSNQGADQRSNIELTTETFDGFSFYWSPNPGNRPECNVQARFNFLSTDFSLSKGVKGVPVRLCAKTEIVSNHIQQDQAVPTREICYCSVKTFRDHGSERKLANDRAHVKKLIERATQQMEQAEAGAKANGKRRRSDSIVGDRPRKMNAHRRATSLSSNSSFDGQDLATDDSQTKLRMLESIPHSIKSVSHLYLRGEEQDDLDSYPVPLLGEPSDASLLSGSGPSSLRRQSTNTTNFSDDFSTTRLPSSHSPSLHHLSRHNSNIYPTPPRLPSRKLPASNHSDIQLPSHLTTDSDGAPQLASPPPSGSTTCLKPQKQVDEHEAPKIDISDHHPNYKAPPSIDSRASAATACFVIKPFLDGQRCFEDDSYRATYLISRDVADFVVAIAEKCGLNPVSIHDVQRVNERGVRIKVEDEMIRHISEGQDMIAEFETVDDKTSLSTHRLTLRF